MGINYNCVIISCVDNVCNASYRDITKALRAGFPVFICSKLGEIDSFTDNELEEGFEGVTAMVNFAGLSDDNLYIVSTTQDNAFSASTMDDFLTKMN